MNRFLRHAAFVTGLAVLAWVGAGYAAANALALAITALIAAFYLVGALELRRFARATATLGRALAELPEPLPELGPWLARLPTGLRNSVRRRIEGEHVGLPGPSLAPYIAGLLVLLGMLGTFVGMVLTLRGTGLALASATDLQAVRNSLVAPVQGLGLAFGTSVAGVASSAALGLMATLARRERALAAQALDACIGSTLRPYSLAHQREESLRLLQGQQALMPALVESLRELVGTLERQGAESSARLLASQEGFQGKAELAYTGLVASVDRSLRDSLSESARIAAATLQPVVESTLAAIASETGALHATLAATAQRQADELAARLAGNAGALAETWASAAERQERSAHALSKQLQSTLAGFAQTFEARSAALLGSLADQQTRAQAEAAATLQAMGQRTAAAQESVIAAAATQLQGLTTRLDDTAQRVAQTWEQTLAAHERASEHSARQTGAALASAAGAFEQHSTALLRTVEQAHARLQAEAAAREQQQLAALTRSVEAMTGTLQREWQHAGAQTLAQQQAICAAMEGTARAINAQSATHAQATIGEIERLVNAAAQAPRAAAEVIAQLREQLSESLARDNGLLDERARMLETLGHLLEGVNRAAHEQRAAIDALVERSAALLERAGARLHEQVDTEAGKLAEVAAQVTGSAVEVASLGESFGCAVEVFSQSNEQLVAQLQRIDGALGKSLARSDEQLEYYVAQAREVVDLSILSQKQIIEELQRLAGKTPQASPAPPAATA